MYNFYVDADAKEMYYCLYDSSLKKICIKLTLFS